MRCKYCGGEINLSVGRCITCGRGVDATSDIRILHDLGDIAQSYGLDPNEDKYDIDIRNLPETPDSDQRTSARLLPPDLRQAKTPNIQLSTYYELLGDDQTEQPPADEYLVENAGQPEDEDTAEEEPVQDSAPEEEPSEAPESEEEPETAGLRGRAEALLTRVDELTAPLTEKVRQWYSAKMPKMNRAQSSSRYERLAVIGIAAAAVIAVIVLISSIASAIPASITGEWQVSGDDEQQLFTVEFSGGEVVARVYDENGEPHIYKRGTYTTSRSSGHDLLTILYEDGKQSNLYYEIKGKTGEFTNVGTGDSDTYKRIG